MELKRTNLNDKITDTINDFNDNWGTIEEDLELKANKKQEAWITPTLLNGATFGNAYIGFGYRLNQFGDIEFRGSLSNLTNGMIVANLPANYRPSFNRIVISQRENSAPFYIQYNANGDLIVFGVSATLTHRHSFDGIRIYK